MKIIISGTDTVVGKTFIGQALAHSLKKQGNNIGCIKPVETGWPSETPDPEEDGVLLAKASGQDYPKAALTRLKEPLAPPLAAKRQGMILNPSVWEKQIEEISKNFQITLIEGAGGLLSPLAKNYSVVDMAKNIGAVFFIVAADKLGSINHCQLVLNHLAYKQLPCIGLAFSEPEKADQSTGTNAQSIREEWPDLKVFQIPRSESYEAAMKSFGDGF